MMSFCKYFFFFSVISFSLSAQAKDKAVKSLEGLIQIKGFYQLTSLKELTLKKSKQRKYRLVFSAQKVKETAEKKKIEIYLSQTPSQLVQKKTFYLIAKIDPRSKDKAILSAVKIEAYSDPQNQQEKRFILLSDSDVGLRKLRDKPSLKTRLIKRHQPELDFLVL